MLRLRLKKFMSMALVVSMLLVMLPAQLAFAEATRTPTPPDGASLDAVLVEGESGTFKSLAGTATDHAYSGTGFGVLAAQTEDSTITYTINVTAAGTYNFNFNFIAGPASDCNLVRPINVYVNGIKVNTVDFPQTSSWDAWQYLDNAVALTLAAGSNTVALETNGIGNGICVDYFYYWSNNPEGTVTSIQFNPSTVNVGVGATYQSIVQAVYDNGTTEDLTSDVSFSSSDQTIATVDETTGLVSGVKVGIANIMAVYGSLTAVETVNVYATQVTTAPPFAKEYQAEDAALSGGASVHTNHTGYTGTGFVGGYDNNGSAKTTFTVNVDTAGTYYADLRYSAGQVSGWPNNRTLGFIVNGVSMPNITFIGTDNTWNTWEENIQMVSLNAGANTIAYTCLTNNDNSDSINLDKLSVWAYHDNPSVEAYSFIPNNLSISVGQSAATTVYAVDSNGIVIPSITQLEYTSSDTSIATVDEATGVVTGVKAGIAIITAQGAGLTGTATVTVKANPTVTVDFAAVTKPVNPSMFGYIVTPNYDVPESRMTLLGPLLNRDTVPVQAFQAIGDLDGSYWKYEDSILQRSLESYIRAKKAGLQYYFLLGHNPSWAAASGGPVDTWGEDRDIKTPQQHERFKQYIKDVLQYWKDNGATPDFANLTNESWTGLEKTYLNLYNAVREVYPEYIPTIGPSGIGWAGGKKVNFWIPFASQNNITVEGPSWHEYWTSDTYANYATVQGWSDFVANLQAQYPEANGKYIIWEENNSGGVNAGGPAGMAIDFTRSMANVVRAGIDYNIKGCLEDSNWNGMSDLMTTNKAQLKGQNVAERRPLWWIHYAFSQLSGQYVTVSTDGPNDFTAAACKDTNESKIIIAKDAVDGSVSLKLNNQPYSGEDIEIDLYKITSTENNGLEYQGSITPTPASTDNLNVTVNNIKANESWMVVIKKLKTPPSFFHQMTPDDGEIASDTPTLTWSASQGATSYTVVVSTNKDLSSPIINQSDITGTSYAVGTPLIVGQKYYWSVTAQNQYGSKAVSYNVAYTFIVGNSVDVPGQFGPYLPSVNAPNESVTTTFQWSTAPKATSYRLVVSENADMSNPTINQSVTSVRNNGHFGNNSQGYYTPTTPLKYDTTYYWTVYAVNANGEREMNGPQHYFTTKAAGNSPTSFNLLSPADGSTNVSGRAVISWEASKNAFFYKLEVSPNQDMSSPVIVRDRMIYNKYTVEPNLLQPDTKYYWRVTAMTKDLSYSTQASNGDILSFTTEAVPCSPLLYAEKASNRKVKLWFNESNTATSYEIKYGTSSGNYTDTITGVTASPYEVTGLVNDTYYFAVVAINESGASSVWNERSATVAPLTSLTPVDIVVYENYAPTLPAAVTALYSDNSIENLPVIWESIDPSSYAQEGTFTVIGTVAGTTIPAKANITVVPVTSITPVNLRVEKGIQPNLPATVIVSSDNILTMTLPVTWDTINPESYAQAGSFTVNGTVANITIKAVANITVTPYLLGTANGSSAASGHASSAAFDGDTDTYYQTSRARANQYVGLDLGAGNAKVIGKVMYYATPSHESALNSAQIQGSNTSSSAGFTTLYTLPATTTAGWNTVNITDTTAYRYLRIIQPSNTTLYVTELQFYAHETVINTSVTLQTEKDSVLPGEIFTVGINLNELAKTIYAQDIALSYDPELFEVNATAEANGTKIIRVDTSVPGKVRLIGASFEGLKGENIPVMKVSFKVKAGVPNGSSIIAVTKADLGVMPEGKVIHADLTSKTITVSQAQVDKSELAAAITSAQSECSNASIGIENGQYWMADKLAFQAAIDAASEVFAKTDATQAEVNSAVDALNAAKDIFQASVITEITGDLNNNASIDVGDLGIVAYYYGADLATNSAAKVADINKDGVVDIMDLAFIATRMLN